MIDATTGHRCKQRLQCDDALEKRTLFPDQATHRLKDPFDA